MFAKDSIWLGAILGFLPPALVYLVIGLMQRTNFYAGRNEVLYLIAIAINLVLMRILHKKGREQIARGIMLTTFLCTLLFFWYKFKI